MSGPEHFREAERLIELIRQLPHPDVGSPTAHADVQAVLDGSASIAAQAQVHATLALAAALDGDRDWTNEADR